MAKDITIKILLLFHSSIILFDACKKVTVLPSTLNARETLEKEPDLLL